MADTWLTKERKIILLIGGLLLLVGALYRFYPVLTGFLPNENALAIKARSLAKLQAARDRRPAVQERVVELTRRLERAERGLLEGVTPALAAVTIQNIINELVEKEGLDLKTTQIPKPKESPAPGFLEVYVRISLELTTAQLQSLLYRIESDSRLLQIDAMRLRRKEKERPDMLAADITVSGYIRHSKAESRS